MTDAELDRRCKVYARQGWYPVKWAHHPPEVRALIRAAHFRPQMKGCFANCQRLMLANLQQGNPLDGLTYHEGYVTTLIPIQHAWLEWRGQRIELTLDPSVAVEYHESKTYTALDILRHLRRDECWCPVDQEQLFTCHPFHGELMVMHRRAIGG